MRFAMPGLRWRSWPLVFAGAAVVAGVGVAKLLVSTGGCGRAVVVSFGVDARVV